ncbi:MAG: OsmC family protein [Gemmatimonadales bacterium]|nr:OsmC family protein [Gemmatimonadales bacterium]NCG32102.1 hypothetical protein [Pseudomonadota bacterium]MBT3499118.1 OsmC family protein [Gemmatimonadales bacterium]MBT3774262.1 OsmC family protein [Gemmatimonadales bacterium]MBT3959670.1 OsmC family protein [Gemmatimonadales bacterium]
MEARGINASDGALIGQVKGEVEKEDDGVIVVKRIHVTYHLKAGEEHRETVQRVHDMHANKCPVYRSMYKAIDITTDFVLKA